MEEAANRIIGLNVVLAQFPFYWILRVSVTTAVPSNTRASWRGSRKSFSSTLILQILEKYIIM